MTDLIRRAVNYVVAALLVPASRLVRVAALRELIEAYTNAYEEAARLEASGKPQLAKFLRAELEESLAAPPAGDPTPQPALNRDSDQHPFALPRPDTSAPAGEGSQPPRRRGRPPRTSAPAQDSSMDSRGEPVWPPAAPPPADGAGPTATIPDPRRRFE